MKDDSTYGFSKPDAEALLEKIGLRDEIIQGRQRPVRGGGSDGVKFFVTGGGGIGARSGATLGSATCTMLTVAGGTRATTSTTATVYNDFLTAIGGSVDIAAAKVDGIWLVIAEDCT